MDQKIQESILNLEDRAAIEELISRYCRLVDSKSQRKFGEIFVDDMIFTIVLEKLTLRGIKRILKHALERSKDTRDRMHVTANLSIQCKGKRAKGLAYWHSTMTYKGIPIVEGGFYDMKFKKENGRWKYTSLRIYHKYRGQIQVASFDKVGYPGHSSKASGDSAIFRQLGSWLP